MNREFYFEYLKILDKGYANGIINEEKYTRLVEKLDEWFYYDEDDDKMLF